MSADWITTDKRDGIAVIILRRPPANAINPAFARALGAAFAEAAASDAKAIILTGSGKSFCAGLDLKEVPTYTADQQREMLTTLNSLLREIYACPKPVIGAVNGHAIAGGFILVLTTDYRVGPSSADALFGLTEVRAGIPFPAVPKLVLQHEMAPADVRYLTLYGQNMNAREAHKRGVFDELVPEGQIMDRTMALAAEFSSMAPDAYERVKTQFRRPALDQIDRVVRENDEPMLDAWVSADAASQSAAILQGSAKS